MSTTLTLYAIEDQLSTLLETQEGGIPAEMEQQFREELATALKTAVEKRDRVAQFIAHCSSQSAFAKEEAKRLYERARMFERAEDRMREYVKGVIESMGTDAKGKYQKLEGRTATFSIRTCPASVEITGEADVPMEYKRVQVAIPGRVWTSICEAYPEVGALVRNYGSATAAVDKTAVKEALQGGREVPGADLAISKTTLQVK